MALYRHGAKPPVSCPINVKACKRQGVKTSKLSNFPQMYRFYDHATRIHKDDNRQQLAKVGWLVVWGPLRTDSCVGLLFFCLTVLLKQWLSAGSMFVRARQIEAL